MKIISSLPLIRQDSSNTLPRKQEGAAAPARDSGQEVVSTQEPSIAVRQAIAPSVRAERIDLRTVRPQILDLAQQQAVNSYAEIARLDEAIEPSLAGLDLFV